MALVRNPRRPVAHARLPVDCLLFLTNPLITVHPLSDRKLSPFLFRLLSSNVPNWVHKSLSNYNILPGQTWPRKIVTKAHLGSEPGGSYPDYHLFGLKTLSSVYTDAQRNERREGNGSLGRKVDVAPFAPVSLSSRKDLARRSVGKTLRFRARNRELDQICGLVLEVSKSRSSFRPQSMLKPQHSAQRGTCPTGRTRVAAV